MRITAARRPAPLVVLLLGAAVGLLIGMVWAVATPVVHRATATVFVAPRSPTAVGDLAQDAVLTQQALDSSIGIATSALVLGPVSRDLSPGLSPRSLAERITVEQPAGTAVLRIHAEDPSAARAAAVANAVASRLAAASERLAPKTKDSVRTRITIVQRARAADVSTGPGTPTGVLLGLLGGLGTAAVVLLVTGRRRPPAGGALAAPSMS